MATNNSTHPIISALNAWLASFLQRGVEYTRGTMTYLTDPVGAGATA